MDPASAMALASASFATIKKGFAIGRDVESMMSDIGRWMSALSDLEQAEKEAKNPPIFRKLFAGKSVEQEAMEIFSHKRRATQQRDELKQWISLTLGMSAWEDLLRTEAKIRKQRQETLYAQREKRRKFVEVVAWIVLIGVGSSVIIGFALLLKAHSAKAETMVTCRKAKCEKINNQNIICIYKGANNTVESMVFQRSDHIPNEFQCKYDPNAKKEMTVQETLKAIKETMD
tara:strand:- start:2772 stop:3464 length:693 start_codon:yes stop_codon:yes gene_type:complete